MALASITIIDKDGNAQVITEAELLASGTTPVTIDTTYGTLEINGYTANVSTGGGVVNYTYSLDDNTLNHTVSGNDAVLDSISITVTDIDGSVDDDTLDIRIVDDVPAAQSDADFVTEDTKLTATGNVFNGGAPTTEDDTIGADNSPVSPVTGVKSGSDTSAAAVGNIATSVTGLYGSIEIAANGSYTYTLTNSNTTVQGLSSGETLTDTFVYTITDGDGDQSTTTLAITIEGTNDGTTIVIPDNNGTGVSGDETVYEAGLPDGSANDNSDEVSRTFTITAPDGLASITILDKDGNAQVITEAELLASGTTPVTIDTTYGTLEINGYTANVSTGGGVVNYTYSLDDNTLNHTVSGNDAVLDSISITVTDIDGSVDDDTLDIRIVDDVPAAQSDADFVTEDTKLTATGNVFNGGAPTTEDDTIGADNSPVSPVTGVKSGSDTSAAAVGNIATSVTGLYGSIEIAANGSYTYTLTNSNTTVQGLSSGETLTDTFVYTITDGDGDQSTTTLAITIEGTNDGTTIVIPDDNGTGVSGDETVYEAGLSDGSTAGSADAVSKQHLYDNGPGRLGSITIIDKDGNPQVITEPQLLASGTTPITIDTTYGTLVINGYTANASTGGGVVNYTYTLDDNTLAHTVSGNDAVLDSISITVTDTDGSSSDDKLDIRIVDDVPTAQSDADSVKEETKLTATGNVFNGHTPVTEDDTIGADNSPVSPVTGVKSGSDTSAPAVGNIATTVTGLYGSIEIAANGSYTYTLTNSNTTVQGLSNGETLTDTFVYTITDADGDQSTTTLAITIEGTNDGTTIVIPDDNGTGVSGDETVYESGLSDGSTAGSASTPYKVSSIFTITAPDGLGSITIIDKDGNRTGNNGTAASGERHDAHNDRHDVRDAGDQRLYGERLNGRRRGELHLHAGRQHAGSHRFGQRCRSRQHQHHGKDIDGSSSTTP